MLLPENAVVRRINELVKRARSVKVHAYIIHYLRKQMPYMMGKQEKQVRAHLFASFMLQARWTQPKYNIFALKFGERVSMRFFFAGGGEGGGLHLKVRIGFPVACLRGGWKGSCGSYLSFPSSLLLSSHYSRAPSVPVVTHVQGYIAGPPAPSPLLYHEQLLWCVFVWFRRDNFVDLPRRSLLRVFLGFHTGFRAPQML